MKLRHFPFFVLLLMAGAVSAQVPTDEAAELAEAQAEKAKMNRYFLAAAKPQGDVASAWRLARAAEFPMPGVPDSKTAAMAIRAAHPIAPDGDPMAVSLRLRDTSLPFSPEERAKAIDTLLAAAAENAYFGLVLLSEPDFKDDVEASDQLFHLVARAPDYDSAYSAQVAGLVKRFEPIAPPPAPAGFPYLPEAEFRFGLSTSLVAMDLMPAWFPVTRICKTATSALKEECRALGQMMLAQADTILEQNIAAALLRLGANDARQTADAAQATRRLHWQQEGGNPSQVLGKSSTDRDKAIFRETLLAKSEVAALAAVLQARGLPLDPPAGWKSSSERNEADAKVAAPKTPR